MRRKTCSNCSRSFTKRQWQQLPLVGHQCVPKDETGPEAHREYRNCPCRSTLLVEVEPGHIGECSLRTSQRDKKKRRALAPKVDRERARIAGEFFDKLYNRALNAYSSHAMRDHLARAVDAAEVAGDAFEIARQQRKARWYRTEARRIRDLLDKRAPSMSSRDPSNRLERRISNRPRSSEGNENLAYLLDRDVRAIGPESAAAPPAKDIRLLISPHGSYRYVGLENGRPVSALQIMSRDGIRGTIENVYTTPAARRRGWAARLLEVARRRFREVRHSDDLSSAGKAWAEHVRDPSDKEGAESWPLTEEKKRTLLDYIAIGEHAEVDADLEETHGNLRESRARSREAGAYYRAAAEVAAVPTVHNRADLRRHNARIELLERARHSFQRGQSYRNAEQVQRLIGFLESRARREYGRGDGQ